VAYYRFVRAPLLLVLLLFPALPCADDAVDATTRAAVEKLGVDVSCYVSPCVLAGDFDGDGKADAAVLVVRKDGKRGIAIVPARGQPSLVGAGHAVGSGGDDFKWMNQWELHPQGPVGQGADRRPPPRLRGDAILVAQMESSSGLIHWDGKRFRWYQQGD